MAVGATVRGGMMAVGATAGGRPGAPGASLAQAALKAKARARAVKPRAKVRAGNNRFGKAGIILARRGIPNIGFVQHWPARGAAD